MKSYGKFNDYDHKFRDGKSKRSYDIKVIIKNPDKIHIEKDVKEQA